MLLVIGSTGFFDIDQRENITQFLNTDLFSNKQGLHSTITSFSYPPRRFSHFISNYVYSLSFISYEMAFCIQSFLIRH